MKTKYRGYTVEKRQPSIFRYTNKKIDYSITRIADNSIVNFGVHFGQDLIKDFIRYLKDQIDDEEEEENPWDFLKMKRKKNANRLF